LLQQLLLPALLAGHTFASMAVLVLPAVAPEVARSYGFDASLIGYQISLVSTGMVVTLTLLGNLSRRLGAQPPARRGSTRSATRWPASACWCCCCRTPPFLSPARW
jgi:MFS family permease